VSDLPLARLIAAGLCLVSGSFVLGAETTLVSLPETRLRALLDELGPARGRHIARYLADPTRVLSRLLAYRITAIIVASTLATDALVRSGDRPLKLVAIVGVLTFLYGALAEIFTSVARSQAWRLAAPALAVTRPLELLMLPMAAPLAWLGRRIHRESAAGARSQSSAVSEREMEYLVEEAENAGTIDARRGEMMQRVLELKDRSARDVMVPRTNINAIDASTPIERALSLVTAEGHSRVPVFRGQIDNIVGILHVKDLFRVAAGLDSMVVGESEILGQVRDAYGAASSAGLARGTLARLFHHALRVGKRARRETGIGRNALSVSRAAVELARHALGDLRDKRVLVVGLGDAGRLAAQALSDAGATDITVTNRTYQRAADMASQLGGRAVPFNGLGDMMEEADIVVSATGSPGYLITPEMVAQARVGNDRPLFLIDIAVPRDIDPAVKAFSGVHLYDIDDLETVAEANRRQRGQEAQKVEAIVEQEVGQFMGWLSSLEVVPTVAALRESADNLRVRELARVMKRLPDLDEEEQRRLTAFSKALVKKLMHQPIASLKEKRNATYTQAARELFDLGKEGE